MSASAGRGPAPTGQAPRRCRGEGLSRSRPTLDPTSTLGRAPPKVGDAANSLSLSDAINGRDSTRIRAISTTNYIEVVSVGRMAATGRPREYDDRVTKAVRMSPDLDERVKTAARERGISANVLINAALEDYLERLLPVDEVLRTAS